MVGTLDRRCRVRRWGFLCTVFAVALVVTASVAAERITVDTTRGAKQSFLFAAPAQPKAAAVLFMGGAGEHELKPSGHGGTSSSNFLIRIFDELVRTEAIAAAVDVPDDKRKASLRYRVGPHEAEDTGAVIAYLRSRANVPVWLIGTSVGTFSADDATIRAPGAAAGLVLTSTFTTPRQGEQTNSRLPQGVVDMDLPLLRLPVLIMAHEDDSWECSPPSGAEALKSRLTGSPRVAVAMISGGKSAKSGPCDPLSPHGYFDAERKG